MDDDTMLQDRAADAGDVIETEPCFDVTEAAAAYLATHLLEDAPADGAVL
jgi:hypothetical protein